MPVPPPEAPRRDAPAGIGRVLILLSLVVAGGCSASSSQGLPAPTGAFLGLADCFVRGTADHHGTTLSADEARRLAANPFGVSLRRLDSLDVAAARELASCRGFLHFCRLATLTPAAAAELSRHVGDLRLDGLEAFPSDTARALAPHAGALHLGGLRSIDVDTATALADHEGFLALNGLAAPEDGVLLALARHHGRLCLNGLSTLSPAVAEALATGHAKASLHGLTELSYRALERFLRPVDRARVELPDWIPIGPGDCPRSMPDRERGAGVPPARSPLRRGLADDRRLTPPRRLRRQT